MAGALTGKFRPISEELSSPRRATRRTISLLVSSASAAKAFMKVILSHGLSNATCTLGARRVRGSTWLPSAPTCGRRRRSGPPPAAVRGDHAGTWAGHRIQCLLEQVPRALAIPAPRRLHGERRARLDGQCSGGGEGCRRQRRELLHPAHQVPVRVGCARRHRRHRPAGHLPHRPHRGVRPPRHHRRVRLAGREDAGRDADRGLAQRVLRPHRGRRAGLRGDEGLPAPPGPDRRPAQAPEGLARPPPPKAPRNQ